MKIKILLLKTWCEKTITPLAWQRIVIRSLHDFRAKGHELSTLEEPSAEDYFGEGEYAVFEKALKELYDLSFPNEIIEKLRA